MKVKLIKDETYVGYMAGIWRQFYYVTPFKHWKTWVKMIKNSLENRWSSSHMAAPPPLHCTAWLNISIPIVLYILGPKLIIIFVCVYVIRKLLWWHENVNTSLGKTRRSRVGLLLVILKLVAYSQFCFYLIFGIYI